MGYMNDDMQSLNNSFQNRTSNFDSEVFQRLAALRDLDSEKFNKTVNLLFKSMQEVIEKQLATNATAENSVELYKSDDDDKSRMKRRNLLVLDRAHQARRINKMSKMINIPFRKRLNKT
jgi:hypothetical protein